MIGILSVPVEDAPTGPRPPTGARVRAPAWDDMAVVGRNPGERGKGAVGPWIS